jgi:TM2 domain-containing membrane protein YozV
MSSAPIGRGKEKVLAGILAILLGWLGVHHFYLGSVTSGILCILLAFCFGIGGIVGIVEGVLLLTMTDEQFNARYNLRTPESLEFVFMTPKA